jgi:hypothetical protein
VPSSSAVGGPRFPGGAARSGAFAYADEEATRHIAQIIVTG